MIEVLEGPITAYKGFNVDMTCKGFYYQMGNTYTMLEHKVDPCRIGYHACLSKNDVLHYYPRGYSKFHKVRLSGLILRDTEWEDSKVVASEISILEEINI